MGRSKNSKNGIRIVRTKQCELCNKEFVANYANFSKVRFCSYSCSNSLKKGRLGKTGSEIQKQAMRSRIGDKHPKWKGGRSYGYKTGYYSTQYKEWRVSVFKRDNYTCQSCGFYGAKGYITAHHIKSFAHYPDLRFEITNGLTLCEPCHSKTDNYRGRNKRKKLTLK